MVRGCTAGWKTRSTRTGMDRRWWMDGRLRFIKPKFWRGALELEAAGGPRLFCRLENPQYGTGMDRRWWMGCGFRFIEPKMCAGRRRGLGIRQTGSSSPRIGSKTLDGLLLRFIEPKVARGVRGLEARQTGSSSPRIEPKGVLAGEGGGFSPARAIKKPRTGLWPGGV